jgi:thiol-disulfide isomerase/thioredoxin
VISKTSLTILAVSIALFFSCTTQKEEPVFSVEGKLNNIDTESVLLQQAKGLNATQFDIVDTLSVETDSTFTSSYRLEPHYYRLRIHDSLHVPFIADSGQQISIRFHSEGKYDVSGSPDTELFEEYEKFRMQVLRETVYPIRKPLEDLLEEDNPEDTARIEKLGDQVLKAEEQYRDTLIHAVKKMGASIAIYPTMVRWNGDKHMDYYDQLATDFAERHKGLEVAKLVSDKVRILKQVSIGGKVSEIVAPDTSGVERSLYNNLGKYTLIDFFGSWCGPCRSESDHLGKMYDRYHSSGFEIFGFGIEYEKDRWIRALKEDNRTWINVSTVDGYSNQIAEEYSITAIPKNFLVNENGIIVAKDIHGRELEEKLEELFSEQNP